MKALIIGGTGPTGPFLINGLIERGYDVSMMHRGTHDSHEIPRSVTRIIADPHFRETLKTALKHRTFDLVIATYGRTRYVAEEIIGKTPRFIAIGGPPSYRGKMAPKANDPPGMVIPTSEDAQLVESEEESRFGYLVRKTEDAVMQRHHDGHYNVTYYRYPVIYGPRQIGSPVWSIIQRVKDKRPCIVLPDGGLTITFRGFSENVAHAVLLSVDQPEKSAGQIYNCGDEKQNTLGQWVNMIARILDYEFEIIGVPDTLAYTARDLLPLGATSHHQLLDIYKIKNQLGYADLVSPIDGIKQTVQWCLENPQEDILNAKEKNNDPLGYKVEDQLIEIYRQSYRQMAAVEHSNQEVYHPYPHPKKPGLDIDHRSR